MRPLSHFFYTLVSPSMNIEPLSSLDEIFPVLTGCDLPVADISASSPPQFFGFRVAGSVVAVIGLEQFQSVGLLRSLAVAPSYRGRGLAQELVSYVESFAASHGVESLFLLTTTAEPFFIKQGYRPTSRQEAPQAIQVTPQFSGLCPSSSAFLSKRVGRANPAVHTDSTPAALRR
jgi:amino-acid N-acetyltransferase